MLLIGVIIGMVIGIVFEMIADNIDNPPKKVVKYSFTPKSKKYEMFIDIETEEILR